MTNLNFRLEARQALDRALSQLATEDATHLKYAALELRLAMEALTYDRARAYAAEIPPSSYDTWQPKKLMLLLLDIDPNAGRDSMLSVGVETEYGVQPAVMKPMGQEKVLSLATLKKHYDALGSYLHMPTIKQLDADSSPDKDKLTKRCKEIAEFIAGVLASPVFNITLGGFAEITCECGATIRKRLLHGTATLEAQCFACPASYFLEETVAGQVLWKPNQQKLRCQLAGCDTPIIAWQREIEPGRNWTCPKCASKNLICVGLVLEAPPAVDN